MGPQFVNVGKREQAEKVDFKYQTAFGKRLKETRESVGWSQVDLAVNSSVSEGQISAIENGHESPRLNTVKALAVALGKTPSELLAFNFEFRLNANFGAKKKSGKKLGTTNLVKTLFDEGFFKTGRSVKEVMEHCKKKFKVHLRSPDTSGALLGLVRSNKLRKIKSSENKNRYQNRS